jgi:uncharacterized protein (TIGR02118 family)
MRKSVCALTRREDFKRDTFQAYYENSHAVLAIKYFPFRHYVRNHVVETPDAGFDTLSEFWSENIEAAATLMNGPVGDIMRADEERFMDRSRITPAGVQEHVLSAGASTDADACRFAALLDWDAEQPNAQAALLEWATDVARSSTGVSLDLTTSWTTNVFPGRAILWTPAVTAFSHRPSWLRLKIVKVRRFETPRDELLTAAPHPA